MARNYVGSWVMAYPDAPNGTGIFAVPWKGKNGHMNKGEMATGKYFPSHGASGL